MVRHQAPALRRLVINIGSNHIDLARTFFGQHFDAFAQIVHTAHERLDLAQRLRPGTNTALGKHGFKGGTYGRHSDQARAARMHANQIVFVGPAGHELFQVGVLQRFVKRGFDIVGRSTHGCCVLFHFWHAPILTRFGLGLLHRGTFAIGASGCPLVYANVMAHLREFFL